MKILLYIFLMFIILDVILFLYFTIHFYNDTKDLNKSIKKSTTMIIMMYTFLYLGIQEKIFGHNYEPRGY